MLIVINQNLHDITIRQKRKKKEKRKKKRRLRLCRFLLANMWINNITICTTRPKIAYIFVKIPTNQLSHKKINWTHYTPQIYVEIHTEKHKRLVKPVSLHSQFHFLHFCDLHGKHWASSYKYILTFFVDCSHV